MMNQILTLRRGKIRDCNFTSAARMRTERAMIVSHYFNLFMLFSFIGWVYECTYCTVREKRWQNRGFLFGPICPIYGIAVVGALILFQMVPAATGEVPFPLWQVFLISMAGSAVLEFVTSVILEKCFHAVWWDYSNIPFNIQGRICLPASLGFGAAGVVIVGWVFPWMESLEAASPRNPLATEAVSLLLAFGLGMDLALTVASLTKIVERMDAAEQQFNARVESGYRVLQQGPAAALDAAGRAAQSAGESAAIAAMLAGDAAREKASQAGQSIQEAAKSVMDGLSDRERYHLRNIRGYRPGHPMTKAASERSGRLFAALQKWASTPEDRHVERKG